MRRAAALALATVAAVLAVAPAAGAQVKAGVAVLDGTYRVGGSAGQYSETRDGGYGDADPHAQSVKNQASYGVQSRESVRALVVRGKDGQYIAQVTNDHYIPQDALFKRTAQLAEQYTDGAIDASNLTLSASHNHSSPSYSSLGWGVWAFQDVFDFRFFAFYAEQNARAIAQAMKDLRPVRVSGTVRYFDKFHKNPMGLGSSDDGTPAGFPRNYTDHDLSIVRFEDIGGARPRPLATMVNIGQHPEFLDGTGLITSEYVGVMQRLVDRTAGGVTLFSQNATGNSEVEEEFTQGFRERAVFNHTQYNQMEWAGRLLADGVLAGIRDIEAQRPTEDADPAHDPRRLYGGTPYSERFVPWMSDFPVGIEDVWFPGPVSHPYPGVSSCRTDAALGGNPRVPVVGLPDCQEVPVQDELEANGFPVPWPGIDTDTLEGLGVPVPENYSAPSTTGLEDTLGVHIQAFRLGEILFTVCPCEQWAEQSFNIKTRLDTEPGNEYLGYDPTAPSPMDAPGTPRHNTYQTCRENGDGTYSDDGTGTGTWTCLNRPEAKLSDRLVQRMRSRILNDAAGWDDPACAELGCGAQAESEPTDLTKIRGGFTHDDTTVRGGKAQTPEYASTYGYRMVVTMSMANDYNGYIASYRDYMTRDHYRKALTGWGPHSMDYLATRLVRAGQALKGDKAAAQAIAVETSAAAAAAAGKPEFVPLAEKETADQAAEDAKVRAVGEAAARAVPAYEATLPDDAGEGVVAQPRDIERFDAATFSWYGGNNYTDLPEVVVERRTADGWVVFGDQSGEVPVSLDYPSGDDPSGLATYRAGGQRWKWTATFEAMVNRFDLVDPAGTTYRATPAGDYRFVVKGQRRSGGRTIAYGEVSDTFRVKPWSGITVEDLGLGDDRRLTFRAGPTNTFTEPHVKSSQTKNWGNVTYAIGPVDYPDSAAKAARDASGFRFFSEQRAYSASETDPQQAEHYCLLCRFRDWADTASGALTAEVTYRTRSGNGQTETVTSRDGTFRTQRALGAGETAEVVVRDEWGNTVREPATLVG